MTTSRTSRSRTSTPAPEVTISETALAELQNDKGPGTEVFKTLIAEGYMTEPGMLSVYYAEAKIFDTYVEVDVKGVKKNISLLNFKRIFDDLVKEESTGKVLSLPYNCYMIKQTPSEIRLACYYPGDRKDIEFVLRGSSRPPKKMKVPFPNIVVTHVLKADKKQWVVQSTRYFATPLTVSQLPQDRFITETDSAKNIFPVPLPNFYTSNTMCYGGNTMPTRFNDSLRGLDYYYQILTIAPFNEDLGIRGLKHGEYDVRQWLDVLKKKTEFDYNDMRGFVPSSTTWKLTQRPADVNATTAAATPTGATATTGEHAHPVQDMNVVVEMEMDA